MTVTLIFIREMTFPYLETIFFILHTNLSSPSIHPRTPPTFSPHHLFLSKDKVTSHGESTKSGPSHTGSLPCI